MKKSKKQIPSTHLKKYDAGGRATSATGRSAQNAQADPASNGNIDYMNDKRTKGLSSDQYMAAAGALTTGLGNMSNVYNDPNSTSRNREEAISSTIKGTIGAVNPVVGGIIGVADAIGKPIRTGLEKTDPTTGKLVDRGGAKAGAVIGSFFSPSKMIGMAAEGNWDITGNKYADNLEKEALDNINAQKAQDAAYNQQMQAQQQQQAQYNLMFQDYQSRNKQFAQGGMNMLPNAELEKSESVVHTNGSFTQLNNEPSHKNGGYAMGLEPGAKVFSDRLKLGKKTFAQLNKSNNTNKEDKILEDSKSGNISTRTAALMKMAKLKSSEELFNIQEQLKQSKVENYAKKMGVVLPTENGNSSQFANGGMANINTYQYPNGTYFGGSEDRETFLRNQSLNNLRYAQPVIDDSENTNVTVPGNEQPSNFDPNTILDPKYKMNNDSENLGTDMSQTKPSWWSNNKQTVGNVAGQVGMGLLQNAGNIYNLSRYNKPEFEQYQRVKASYLDPTAAIRDAEQENRRAEVDIRNATSGNAGNYLSNRVALSTKNALNKDRVRQQYANTNAGIANQNSQVNADISMREIIANAQNRARTRSGKEEAISQIGSNVANQFLDNKKGKMDQDTLQLMMKYYDAPEFQKALKESNFNKQSKKAGK